MKKLLAIILCLCVCCTLCACDTEKIVWSEMVLGEILPEPPANKGEIYDNSAENLWIEISDISDKQFADYVEACKEKGFAVDADSNSSSYNAYNAEGYKLSLGHYGSDADMTIQLEPPMETTDIIWPTSVAGKLLPTPKSLTGKFSYENDDSFFVYISNTSKTDYAEYVNACSEKGFNVDYSKGDNYYYANNNDGWKIDLRYVGNNTMSISISAPSKEDDTVNTTALSTEKPSTATTNNETKKDNADSGVLGSDFKAAMDSYESFMDEYVAFMKKYNNNPTDPSLLTDYADYMSKYAKFVKEFNEWEDKKLNSAETLYYIEVQTRVNKKLLEVASN